jgi:hypothetical protein
MSTDLFLKIAGVLAGGMLVSFLLGLWIGYQTAMSQAVRILADALPVKGDKA